MKKHLYLAALILVGAVASGCGPYHYHIKVNGYLDPAAPK